MRTRGFATTGLPDQDTSVDLREYLAVLRRRKWVVILSALLPIALAALYSFRQTPYYEARAEVLVKPITTTTFGQGVVNIDTEKELVLSTTVAVAARDLMGANASPSDILANVSVQVEGTSEVLSIIYTHTDPEVARLGAGSFARAYLEFKREQGLNRLLEATDSINGQIQEFEEQLGKASEEEVSRLENQIDFLRSQLASLSTVAIDPGEIIAPAEMPTEPAGPNHVVNLLLGLFLGLVMGVTLAFVRDRTDMSIRERSDMEQALALPVLGLIPAVPGWRARGRPILVTVDRSTSPAAEAYRSLRTSMLAMGAERGTKVIMVVSALPREGKTTTASNLAVALAQVDKRVLLISTDLRRPRAHEFFHMSNAVGLSNVLLGELSPLAAIQESGVSGLWILASGPHPDQPTELLQSERMRELLNEVRDLFDFVVLDSSPILPLADSLAIAPHVDSVLFVARAGSTHEDALIQARISLEQVGAPLLGAVLNDFNPTQAGSQYYGYAAEYGPSKDGAQSRRSARSAERARLEGLEGAGDRIERGI